MMKKHKGIYTINSSCVAETEEHLKSFMTKSGAQVEGNILSDTDKTCDVVRYIILSS